MALAAIVFDSSKLSELETIVREQYLTPDALCALEKDDLVRCGLPIGVSALLKIKFPSVKAVIPSTPTTPSSVISDSSPHENANSSTPNRVPLTPSTLSNSLASADNIQECTRHISDPDQQFHELMRAVVATIVEV